MLYDIPVLQATNGGHEGCVGVFQHSVKLLDALALRHLHHGRGCFCAALALQHGLGVVQRRAAVHSRPQRAGKHKPINAAHHGVSGFFNSLQALKPHFFVTHLHHPATVKVADKAGLLPDLLRSGAFGF